MPTLPAESVARTISRCVPGFKSGSESVIFSAGGIEQTVIRENRDPVPAVERVVGLDQPGQLVFEHDRGPTLSWRDLHRRRVVVDDERHALAVARSGLVGAVGGSVAGQRA